MLEEKGRKVNLVARLKGLSSEPHKVKTSNPSTCAHKIKQVKDYRSPITITDNEPVENVFAENVESVGIFLFVVNEIESLDLTIDVQRRLQRRRRLLRRGALFHRLHAEKIVEILGENG